MDARRRTQELEDCQCRQPKACKRQRGVNHRRRGRDSTAGRDGEETLTARNASRTSFADPYRSSRSLAVQSAMICRTAAGNSVDNSGRGSFNTELITSTAESPSYARLPDSNS